MGYLMMFNMFSSLWEKTRHDFTSGWRNNEKYSLMWYQLMHNLMHLSDVHRWNCWMPPGAVLSREWGDDPIHNNKNAIPIHSLLINIISTKHQYTYSVFFTVLESWFFNDSMLF